MKVYFSNNWGESDEMLTLRMKTTTPENKGIWKNISYTSNLNEADYVVCLGGLNRRLNFPLDKIIILQREPELLRTFKKENKLSFPYTSLNHAWTHPEHMQMDYNMFSSIKYTPKTKNISSITTMRKHTPLCKQRIEFIQKFCKKYPNIMDVYGAQWDNSLGSSYKGELPFHNLNGANNRFSNNPDKSKYVGLKDYKYSLCIENSCYDNYFTEKITDCLLSWTIPIYFGCTNISNYFPKDSYIWLDINDPNSIDKLNEIIQKPISEKNVKAMQEARNLILEKYNIWELVHNIIKNN
tara:strand:+ start:484 stop:1371 length:888 start_codon:yes stop_codon:yes gene_type:complete